MGVVLPNGYEMKSTFYSDFSIADAFGLGAIRDTYDRAFKEWKSDVIYLSELCIVLNHKIWEWYQKDDEIAKLYDELWRKVQDYAYTELNEEDVGIYYRITN